MAFAGAACRCASSSVVAAVSAAAVVARPRSLRRVRPELLPTGPLPRPRALAHGLLLSAGYQLSIAGPAPRHASRATGHTLSPLAVLGAFGASQLAGAVPGPNGASPRDGALVLGLVAAGCR